MEDGRRSFGERMKVKERRIRVCQHGSVEKGMRTVGREPQETINNRHETGL